MTQGVQNALIITLSVHAVALFTLTQITVMDEVPDSDQFTEIELFNPEDVIEQEEFEVPVDPIQQRINKRISNLRSDAVSYKHLTLPTTPYV